MASDDIKDQELDTGERAVEMEPLIQVEQQPDQAKAVHTWIPSVRRCGLASVGLLLVAGICLAGLHMQPFRGVSVSVPVSSGYINLNAVGVTDDAFTEHPDICDAEIVAKACMRINQETTEFYGNTLDRDLSVVNAEELQEVFMVDRESLMATLTELRVVNLAQASDDPMKFSVRCSDLCAKTAESFSSGTLPAKSNVACVSKGWWIFKTTDCDIDVSESALASLHEFPEIFGPGKASEPNFATPAGDKTWEHIQEVVTMETEGDPHSSQEAEKAVYDLNYRPSDSESLLLDIANYFSFFPPIKATASSTGASSGNLQGRRLQSNWEAETIQLAQLARSFLSKALQAMNSMQIPHIVKEWYGKNDQVTRASVKRLVIGVMELLGNVQYIYKGYYCENRMYAYVHPTENTVIKGKRLDRNPQTGQFMFFLCDLYFNTDQTGKLETLFHEASHHLMMALDDTQYTWGNGACATSPCTLYGKGACRETAAKCHHGDRKACTAVLRNAENFCFFAYAAGSAAPKISTTTRFAATSNAAATADDNWDRDHDAASSSR